VAWQVGHLAAAQASLVQTRCFDKPIEQCIPPAWKELFGIGSAPSPDAATYPSTTELREHFDRVHAESVDLIATLSPAELEQPPGPRPHPMFNTKRGALATAFTHEAFHAGQIALLRRLLGKPPLR
jgi:uncharacterized damage-inducible protein DinB